MDFLSYDFAGLFSISSLFAIALGTIAGLIIGTLPGMGATIAIVLMLPLTYSMDPLASILLLVAAYQGAEYGGSISSIIRLKAGLRVSMPDLRKDVLSAVAAANRVAMLS